MLHVRSGKELDVGESLKVGYDKGLSNQIRTPEDPWYSCYQPVYNKQEAFQTYAENKKPAQKKSSEQG